MAAADRELGRDAASGPDVFVSYSRADQPFVRRLDAALRDRGKDPWIDWDDIPPTADWRARIFAGIVESRAFVSVLSPDLISSKVAAEELSHAVGSNKRVVPLLHREIDSERAPEALLSPNWIYVRDDDDFDRALDELVKALETDLAWLDAHARLLTRATEWERASRDASFLLRGRDLQDAEAWLAEQGGHREAATPLQTEFVVTSRRASVRRQRALLGGVAAALAISVALGVVALLQRNDAIDQSHISRSRELAVRAISGLASDPQLSLLLAREALDAHRTPQAEDALLQALRASHLRLTVRAGGPLTSVHFSPDGSRIVVAAGRTVAIVDARTGRVLMRLRGHRAAVNGARFSDDGERVLTTSPDRTARVWSARSGRQLALIRTGGDAGDGVFSPDGARVLTGGTARLWSAGTGRRIASLGVSGVVGVAFSPHGERAVTAGNDGAVTVWDGHTGKRLLRRTVYYGQPVGSSSFSPDGRLLVTVGWHDLRVWNLASRRLVKAVHAPDGLTNELWIRTAQFSQDGAYAITGGMDGRTVVWSVPGWHQMAEMRGHSGAILSAEFSVDTKRVLTVGDDGTARAWDTITGAQLAVLRVPGEAITTAEFAPDGNRVVTASGDRVRVWAISGFAPVGEVTPGAGPPAKGAPSADDVVFSPDGRTFATRDENGSIDIWRVSNGGHVLRLRDHAPDSGAPVFTSAPSTLAFSPDGRRIVAIEGGTESGHAVVWNVWRGTVVSRLRGYPIRSAVFTADGEAVLTAGGGEWVWVWNASTGRLERSVRLARSEDTETEAFSPDGTRCAGWNGTHVAIWDVATGRLIAALSGKLTSPLIPPTFSPDGKRVFFYELSDGTARIWDAASGAAVSPVFRLQSPVEDAAFSPDGEHVLTRESGGTAELWDTRTGELLGALRAHAAADMGERLDSASFSPDGRLVVTSGFDGTAKLWDASSLEPVATLRQRLGVNGYPVIARFSPDGLHLAVAGGGTATFYRCEECGAAREIERLADQRIELTDTAEDRARLAFASG